MSNIKLKKALLDAFNLSHYYYPKINSKANLALENGKIVACFTNTDLKEYIKYIQDLRKEIVKRHGGSEAVAGRFFNLNSFPFVFDGKEYKDGTVSKYIINYSDEVFHNLRIHLIMEFQRAVERIVATKIEEIIGIEKNEIYQYIIDNVLPSKRGVRGNSSYMYQISFKENKLNKILSDIIGDPADFHSFFREVYTEEFKLRADRCNNDNIFSDYQSGDKELYIQDVGADFADGVVQHISLQISINGFDSARAEVSEAGNLKDILSDKICQITEKAEKKGIVIDGYKKIAFNADNYFLVPKVQGELSTTREPSKEEIRRINKAFKEDGLCKEDLLINVKNQLQGTKFGDEDIYAVSHKQLALLIPELMKAPIKHDRRSGFFEYTVPLIQHQREEARDSDTKTPPTEDKEQSQHLVTSDKQEIFNPNTKTPPSERRHLTPAVQRSQSHSPRKDGGGILPRNHSDVSVGTSWSNQANHLAVNNGKVMSTSAHSQNSQNSVDSGLGSTFYISQLDDLKPTLQSMKYVAPLPQQSTNIAHQLPNKSDTIVDDLKPTLQSMKHVAPNVVPRPQQSTILNGATQPPLPSVAESGEYNASISSHTSSNGSLSGKPQTNMSITPKPANKTSQEKPKDLSSSTSIRSSLRNLNVFKHARGVNTHKSDQREQSSCIIL